MANSIPIFSDIKINLDDVELDSFSQPVFIYDIDVVIQDIRHAIRESGLLEHLISERSYKHQALVFNKLKMLVEQDERIEPGSSEVNQDGIGNILITAISDFGDISIEASI